MSVCIVCGMCAVCGSKDRPVPRRKWAAPCLSVQAQSSSAPHSCRSPRRRGHLWEGKEFWPDLQSQARRRSERKKNKRKCNEVSQAERRAQKVQAAESGLFVRCPLYLNKPTQRLIFTLLLQFHLRSLQLILSNNLIKHTCNESPRDSMTLEVGQSTVRTVPEPPAITPCYF